jgi:hypothetical protein
MPKPFFERLGKYYSDIGKVLRGEAGVASIFPNTTDIGMSREQIYAEVLRLHLPSSCNVFLGGFLFDQNGKESKQIDILIINESSIQFNFHNRNGSGKSFACIDGCVGLVSAKSKLDSSELFDALHNIASIPDKQPLHHLPLIKINEYDDWPYKVIYASDGISLENLSTALNEFYKEHSSIPPHKRPNLIHVAGKYVIVRTKPGNALTRNGTVLEVNTFYPMASGISLESSDAFALLYAISQIQGIVAASKYVRYEYKSMIDKIPF